MIGAIIRVYHKIGPGILFAGIAIGGSHLIQSTRAGATYGFTLLGLVLLTNLLKYPFFEYGHRYTASTGENLLTGYKKLGKWALNAFFAVCIVTALINTAAVTFVCAGLCAYFFELQASPLLISTGLLILCAAVLIIGKYQLLDNFMKVLISLLALTTVIAFALAFSTDTGMESKQIPPEIWNTIGIGFLLALMGWMPAPIEASVFSSLWTQEKFRNRPKQLNMGDALLDFHVGYITTAILALIFLSLGALLMFQSGEQFEASGIAFSKQLVELYTVSIGEWSRGIIAFIAFITMFSTTLALLDAYPRALAGSISILFKTKLSEKKWHVITIVICTVLSIWIISFFSAKEMKKLIDLATVISFLAAPLFAYLNYLVVTKTDILEKHKPKPWLRWLSLLGMNFLIGFSILFLFTKFVA